MTKKSNGQTDGQGRSYRPGSWFGIFGDHATVILPPTEKSRVAALWELVDDGAGFDDVLDTLVASGLSALPGFVLLSRAEGATRVLLRGSAAATFTLVGGETIEVTSTKGGTWAERTLEKVESVQLALEDGAAGDDLVIGGGLVRVAQVDEPPQYAEGGARVAEADVAAAPVAEPEFEPEPEPEPEAVVEEAAPEAPAGGIGLEKPAPVEQDSLEGAPVEEPEAAPEPESDMFAKPAAPEAPYPGPDSQGLPPENPFGGGEQVGEQGGGQPEWQPEPAYAPEGGMPPANPFPGGDPLSGQEWQPADAPQAPYPPQGEQQYAPTPDQGQAAEEDADHDGYTRAGAWDPGQFARPQPGIPGQPQAPSVTARPVANLIFSSGETIEVDRAILIGRAPEARRFTSTDQPRLVTVPSPNQEISSTHLEIRPGSGADHGAAIVTDMGSTNGTVLVQPGLQPEELQPGIAVALIPGAVVDLGDGVTIQVLNP
ncbi:FHA domain-containing protein [Nocardioides speluncae]|uniref:FHA domain-containing protein n=1 Tax=Nocardioides speluncae TaxID=2670337 RepID=UPI000D689E0B|nr:FHA domain-containing protein [Nocardioides speluncae]